MQVKAVAMIARDRDCLSRWARENREKRRKKIASIMILNRKILKRGIPMNARRDLSMLSLTVTQTCS